MQAGRARRTAAAGLAAAVVAAGLATAGGPAAGAADYGRYEVGLFGDLPYGDEGRAEFPSLVADMNRAPLAFSVFDGDIKSGSEVCDNALYTTTKRRYARFEAPVVLTPGDNDWTDCHRENNGSYDPLERLDQLREVLFATPNRSLGGRTMAVKPQSSAYPENARWSKGPVTWATVHVVGSNNNLIEEGDERPPAAIAAANAEYRARNTANQRWIRAAFASAKYRGSRAVVLVIQAEMFGNEDSGESSSTAQFENNGFSDTLRTLRTQTAAFDGEVVLVHGDEHLFVIDKPLLDAPDGEVLTNFTRVQTFGDADTHWVSAVVDPTERNVLTFRPRIVPRG